MRWRSARWRCRCSARHALQRYIDRGLRVFTPATITSPERLRAQLADIRAGAVAFDCEEFRADFCCLAAPVRNAAGRPVAALGISMSARCFELERASLEAVLVDVAERASAVLAAARASRDLGRPTRS